MKITIGQHNTGCERRIRDVIMEEPVPPCLEEAAVSIAHKPQPRFDTIQITLAASVGTEAHARMFEITLDEVRATDYHDCIMSRWRKLVAAVKNLVEKVDAAN